MGPHEVIKCDEERCQCACPIKRLKASPWPGVVFICPVEALNKLFELAIFSAFLVHVLETDNGFFRKLSRVVVNGFIISHDGRIVGRIAVGDQLRDRGVLPRITVTVVE